MGAHQEVPWGFRVWISINRASSLHAVLAPFKVTQCRLPIRYGSTCRSLLSSGSTSQPLRSSLLSDPKHLRFQACFRCCLRIPHGVMTNAYFSHLSSEHYNSWSLHIIRKIISNFNNDIFPRMKSLQISIRNEETFLIQSNLHRISKQNTSYKLGMPFFFPHRKP